MASSDRIDELKRKFDENPRRYFAPLANEFRKGGDLDQAILICQEFLPQQPGHMSGHIVYGQALYETGRLDEARGVFETALSLDPENLIALRHLGDIAGRQGDPTSARRWYERVLEADPRNDEIQSLLAGLHDAPAGHDVAPTPDYAMREPSVEHVPLATEHDEPPQRPAPIPADEPELLDLEVTIPATAPREPVAAESASSSDSHASRAFDLATSGDIEPTPETADLMPSTDGKATGFESTEFSAPDTPVQQTPGLESAFEVETGVHVAHFAPLPGLDRPQTTIDPVPGLATTGAFPELDEPISEDRGDVLPPHGDPIVESAPAPAATSRDDSLLDLDMPVLDEPGRDASAEAEQPSSVSEDVVDAESGAPTLPTELPPEVIAAEAALISEDVSYESAPEDVPSAEPAESESVGNEISFIDVGDTAEREPVASSTEAGSDESQFDRAAADEPSSASAAPGHRPFVTETMAELYLKQGFRQEALSVYEQLSSATPGDERLSGKIASLRAELTAPPKAGVPAVREFFARIAARRPGERAVAAAPPSDDDFGPSEDEAPMAASTAPAEPSSSEGDRVEPSAPASASPERPGGSIDALFGHRPSGTSEDSAASALAQAFGSGTDATPLAGNPTRPASGELSLDSVFREGSRTPRTSQGFSFDQFFSQNVEGDKTSGGGRTSQEASAAGEPAERSEDDIEQFNSWLQGLKQR
jgi:tetratricopeptide (TPR) repeat protein